jgi:HEAT repeat protein
VEHDSLPPAFDECPPRRRRYRFSVLTLMALIVCCAVMMWAARTLWESQHPAIAAARGLRSGKASKRLAAIRDVASLGSEDSTGAIPPLIERLRDADAEVRAAAADALGLVGSSAIKVGLGVNEVRAAITALVESLHDQQPTVQRAAANALGSIANCDATRIIALESAANALIMMLDNRNTDVRASVIGALGFVGPRVLVEPPPAIVAALEDESSKVRAEAVASLANYTRGLPRLIPSLLQSMHLARREARTNYLTLFESIQPPRFSAEAVRSFILGLGSDYREIRYLAASRLAVFGRDAREAIPFLIKTLGEPMDVDITSRVTESDNPWAREPSLAAAIALVKIAPGTDLAGQAASALAEAVRSGAPACRSTSIQALSHFGPEAEAVIPTLIAELRQSIEAEKTVPPPDPNSAPYSRAWQIDSINQALGGIAPGTASADMVVDVLAELLQSHSARHSAISAVSRFGPNAARVVPQLRALRNDPDPPIASAAAMALRDLKASE